MAYSASSFVSVHSINFIICVALKLFALSLVLHQILATPHGHSLINSLIVTVKARNDNRSGSEAGRADSRQPEHRFICESSIHRAMWRRGGRLVSERYQSSTSSALPPPPLPSDSVASLIQNVRSTVQLKRGVRIDDFSVAAWIGGSAALYRPPPPLRRPPICC